MATNTQHTSGQDVSSSGYERSYDYPLSVFSNYSFLPDNNVSIVAEVERAKNVRTLGSGVFPTGVEGFEAFVADGSGDTNTDAGAEEENDKGKQKFEGAHLQTTQNGSATYLANTTAGTSFSFGSTAQEMVFLGIITTSTNNNTNNGKEEVLFYRFVDAVNGTVLTDREIVVGKSVPSRPVWRGFAGGFAEGAVEGMLGRGPQGGGGKYR